MKTLSNEMMRTINAAGPPAKALVKIAQNNPNAMETFTNTGVPCVGDGGHNGTILRHALINVKTGREWGGGDICKELEEPPPLPL